MSLNFTPTNYVDGKTIITAQNLNDIQDAFQDLYENKVEAVSGKGLSTNDFSNEEKAKVDSALQPAALQPYRTASAQDVIDQAKYEKPSTGIPKTDLSDDVQTSLDKADTAAPSIAGVYYGVCDTGSAVSTKVVTILGITELTVGTTILVRFVNGQTYTGVATLNVNNLGAKRIMMTANTSAPQYTWSAQEIVMLVYDGTNWTVVDGAHATTTYWGVTKLFTGATSDTLIGALTPASLNSLVQNMIANYPVYSISGTYEVGERVRYGYQIWQCNTAITTAESWTEAHWTPLKTLLELIEENTAPIGLGMTGATVGQVPVVKTVDENGVPTSYEPGAGGGVLPPGGSDGDVLVKNGATDYDAKWTSTPPQMGSLATIETSQVENPNGYKRGDYLVYNGRLYKVTRTISQGQTLTPGGNIVAVTVADRLVRYMDITITLTTSEPRVRTAQTGLSAQQYVLLSATLVANNDFYYFTATDGILSALAISGTDVNIYGLNKNLSTAETRTLIIRCSYMHI